MARIKGPRKVSRYSAQFKLKAVSLRARQPAVQSLSYHS